MKYLISVLILLLAISVFIANPNLLDKVAINPAGTEMQPKIMAEGDVESMDIADIDNTRTPYRSKVRYGTLDSLKESTTDANGTTGVLVNGETQITDMSENAKANSKIAPAPDGVTITRLPGFQPDHTVNNTIAMTLTKGASLKAPRSFYTTGTDVIVSYYLDSKDVYKYSGGAKIDASSALTVFQVPFGENSVISDTTGTSTTASAAQKVKANLLDYLKKLDAADKGGKKTKATLNDLLFTNSKISDLNNLINTGLYSKAYRSGLARALGSDVDGATAPLPLGSIKVQGVGQTIYDQFDFIYDYMKLGKGKGVYNQKLVDWAKTNSDSILQLLMVNYMLQSSFEGTDMNTDSPMTLGNWGEESVKFETALKKAGKQTKEPFFLYCSFNGTAMKKGSDDTYQTKALPVFTGDKMHVDLSYIFHLYSGIMFEIWQGTDSDGFSEIWKQMLEEFDAQMAYSPISGSVASNANNVAVKYLSEDVLTHNSLGYGLSRYTKGKEFTEAIYGTKKDIVASLRILLSRGEEGASSGSFKINGRNYGITPLSNTKRNEPNTTTIRNQNKMYNDFKSYSGSAVHKFEYMLLNSASIEEYPATFESHWNGEGTINYIVNGVSAPEYLFLPSMMGGSGFVTSVTEMVNSLTLDKNSTDKALPTMSFANRYIILYNFKANAATMTTNTTGLRKVETNANTGSARDSSKPIVITGYNGGENFSFPQYVKAQELLSKGSPSSITAKKANGSETILEHINLTKQFFTINTIKDFIGAGSTGEVSMDATLKEGYKNAYKSKLSSPVTQWISPNYNTFFDGEATDWGK